MEKYYCIFGGSNLVDKIRVDRGQLKIYSNKIRASVELLSTFLNDLEKEIDSMSDALEGDSASAYKEELKSINTVYTKKFEDILDKAADEMDLTVERLLDADKEISRTLNMVRDARGIKPVQVQKLGKEAVNVDLRSTFGMSDSKVGLTQCVGDPVNAATGNFILEESDLIIDGFSPIEFKRFYNAMDNWQGDLGGNWYHNFGVKIKRVSASITEVTSEDGHVEYFILRENAWYSTEPEKKNRLEINENEEYILKRGDKVEYTFSKEGTLNCLKNGYGSIIRIQYNEYGNIGKIENNCGSLRFEYDDDKIIKVVDNTGRQLEYGYSDGNLTSVKSVEGYTFRYEYDDKHRITRIINPLNNVTVTNIYDENGRTIEQTMADGTVNKFSYEDSAGTTVFTEGNGVEVIYKRDERFRIYETVYVKGSKKITFNDNNQITAFTDRNQNTYHYKYDLFGNLARETNPLGHVTEYSYDEENRLVSIKNPDRGVYSYSYDAKGNLNCIKDPNDRKLNIEYNDNRQLAKIVMPDENFYSVKYDAKGNPLEVKDPMGNISRFEYDELNRVKRVTKPKGNSLEFEYTPGGKIKKLIYPDGSFEKFAYDKRGLLIERINENGHSEKNKYNSIGKIVEKIDFMGNVTRYEYDGMWNITKIVKPDESEVHYKYNSSNKLEELINEEGFSARCEYDANGNIVKMVDPRGNESEFSYNALNMLIKEVSTNNAVTGYEYTWDGKIQKVFDALNGVTEFKYDLSGQLTVLTDPLGNSTAYTYNESGLIETVTKPYGGVVNYEYDPSGRLVKLINPDKSELNFEYDGNGNMSAFIDGLGNRTCYEYDSMDRVIKMSNAQGGTRFMEYTKSGKVASITDENGIKTQYEYDVLDRLVKVIDANGGKTEYVYDTVGNLVEMHQFFGLTRETIDGMHPYNDLEPVIEPFSNKMVTSYKYDKRGLILEEKNPAGHVTVFSYDENGNLISQTDRDGYVTMFQYDCVNNLKKAIFHDGKEVEYQYDLLGRMTGLTDWLGKTGFELDVLGRIRKVKDYANRITEYIYGAEEERQHIKYPDGTMVSYEYDIMGRLEKVRDINNGDTSYRYDGVGNIIEKILPNNVKTKYEYDSLFRLMQMTNTDASGNVLDKFKYKYDAIGNRISILRNSGLGDNIDGETVFGYDCLNQLTQVENPDKTLEKYFYDTTGNRVRLENWNSGSLVGFLDYKYDNQARLTEITGENTTGQSMHTTMQYDKRGNLLNTLVNGVLTRKYTFNEANQLASAITKQGDVVNFTYDGFGRRAGLRTENLTQHYVFDITKPYQNLLMIFDNNLETQSYTCGLDLTSVTSSKGTLYYMNDELGSPISLLDNNGTTVASYGYGAFGIPVVIKSLDNGDGSIVNPVSYTGYQYDVTGLMYAQARYYMPELGRFISEDGYKGSIIESQSLNSYVYCKNNPLIYIDPTGFCGEKKKNKNPDGIYLANTTIQSSNGVIDYSTKVPDNSLGAILQRAFFGSAPLPDNSVCVVAGTIQTGSEAYKFNRMNSLKAKWWAKGWGQNNANFYKEYAPIRSFWGNNPAQKGWFKGVSNVCSKVSYVATFGIPIFNDVYNNIQSGADWKEYAADIAVDIGVGFASMGAGTGAGIVIGFFLGIETGPGAIVTGAAGGVVGSVAVASVFDGISLGFDQNGNNVSLKQGIQNYLKNQLDIIFD